MAEIKMDPSSESLPKRKGNYFSLAKKKELEGKKAEEEKIATAKAQASREAYNRALSRSYRDDYDDDNHPFHGGEGSC